MNEHPSFTLAELLIVAASEAWRDNGEVLASGLGIIPRLGASLAKLTHSPGLLMTDSEAFLVEEPIPVGPRGDFVPRYSGHMSFERVFDCVWRGLRHAMIGPTQIDRWAQTNLSCVGDYRRPTAAMLGVHERTVSYRLSSIEEVLPEGIAHRRGELVVALSLHRLLIEQP